MFPGLWRRFLRSILSHSIAIAMTASPDSSPADPIQQLLNTLSDLYDSQKENIRNQTKTLARIETAMQQLRQKLHESTAGGSAQMASDKTATESQAETATAVPERPAPQPSSTDPSLPVVDSQAPHEVSAVKKPVSPVDSSPSDTPPIVPRPPSLYRTLEDEPHQPTDSTSIGQPLETPTLYQQSSEALTTPPAQVPPATSHSASANAPLTTRESAPPQSIQQLVNEVSASTTAEELEAVKSIDISPNAKISAATSDRMRTPEATPPSAPEPKQLFPPEGDEGIDERNLLEQIHRFTETLSESTAFWQQVTIPRGNSGGVLPIQPSDSDSGPAAQYENNSRSPYSH